MRALVHPSLPCRSSKAASPSPGECARCHGRLARGTERGPDLIHPVYGPSVRSDAQFRRAVREGLPARRGYGAMPPSPDVSKRRLERMIAFLRELQRADGIR